MKLWVMGILNFLLWLSRPIFAHAPVAHIQIVKNDVKILRHPNRKVELAKVGLALFKGDRVLTGQRSMVRLNFVGGDRMVLGAEGKIQIDFLASEPVKLINLLYGQVRSQVQKRNSNKLKMVIKTKSAALGVRGTDFQIKWDPDEELFQSYVKNGHVVLAEVYEGQDYNEITAYLLSPYVKDVRAGEYLEYHRGLWTSQPNVVTIKKVRRLTSLEEDPTDRIAKEAMENARKNTEALMEEARELTNIYRSRLGR